MTALGLLGWTVAVAVSLIVSVIAIVVVIAAVKAVKQVGKPSKRRRVS